MSAEEYEDLCDQAHEQAAPSFSRFEFTLLIALLLACALWTVGYQHYLLTASTTHKRLPVNVDIRKASAEEALAVVEPSPEVTSMPNVNKAREQNSEPTPITPAPILEIDDGNDTSRPRVNLPALGTVSDLLFETMRLSTPKGLKESGQQNRRVFHPRLRSQLHDAREATAARNRRNREGVFDENNEAFDSSGDLLVKTASGCIIRQESTGALEGLWFIVGCPKDEIKLNIPKTELPSFERRRKTKSSP